MKENLKSLVIKYLEAEGQSSKSKIEDYMKELKGTTGDCISRRLRELVASGVVLKEQKEYEGKKYFSYRVNPLPDDCCDLERPMTEMEAEIAKGLDEYFDK